MFLCSPKQVVATIERDFVKKIILRIEFKKQKTRKTFAYLSLVCYYSAAFEQL